MMLVAMIMVHITHLLIGVLPALVIAALFNRNQVITTVWMYMGHGNECTFSDGIPFLMAATTVVVGKDPWIFPYKCSMSFIQKILLLHIAAKIIIIPSHIRGIRVGEDGFLIVPEIGHNLFMPKESRMLMCMGMRAWEKQGTGWLMCVEFGLPSDVFFRGLKGG